MTMVLDEPQQLVPIASLSPELSTWSTRSIKAVVTLVWPYGSSTRKCALLLAESDFRLRRRRGQVVVRFEGSAAKAVADAKIHIGDEVHLALNGARWAKDEESERTQTPGRSIEYELNFRSYLQLQAFRAGERIADVRVERDASPEPSPESIATPQKLAGNEAPAGRVAELRKSDVWTSPIFRSPGRFSNGSVVEPDLGLDEEESYAEPPAKKRILSWKRSSGNWTFAREKSPAGNDAPKEHGASPKTPDEDADAHMDTSFSVDKRGESPLARKNAHTEELQAKVADPSPEVAMPAEGNQMPHTLPILDEPLMSSQSTTPEVEGRSIQWGEAEPTTLAPSLSSPPSNRDLQMTEAGGPPEPVLSSATSPPISAALNRSVKEDADANELLNPETVLGIKASPVTELTKNDMTSTDKGEIDGSAQDHASLPEPAAESPRSIQWGEAAPVPISPAVQEFPPPKFQTIAEQEPGRTDANGPEAADVGNSEKDLNQPTELETVESIAGQTVTKDLQETGLDHSRETGAEVPFTTPDQADNVDNSETEDVEDDEDIGPPISVQELESTRKPVNPRITEDSTEHYEALQKIPSATEDIPITGEPKGEVQGHLNDEEAPDTVMSENEDEDSFEEEEEEDQAYNERYLPSKADENPTYDSESEESITEPVDVDHPYKEDSDGEDDEEKSTTEVVESNRDQQVEADDEEEGRTEEDEYEDEREMEDDNGWLSEASQNDEEPNHRDEWMSDAIQEEKEESSQEEQRLETAESRSYPEAESWEKPESTDSTDEDGYEDENEDEGEDEELSTDEYESEDNTAQDVQNPSQEESPVVIDLLSDTDEDSEMADDDEDARSEAEANPATSSVTAMQPPPLPRLQTDNFAIPTSPQLSLQDGVQPVTPVLQPLSSAVLPLPSPFPADAETVDPIQSYQQQQQQASPTAGRMPDSTPTNRQEHIEGHLLPQSEDQERGGNTLLYPPEAPDSYRSSQPSQPSLQPEHFPLGFGGSSLNLQDSQRALIEPSGEVTFSASSYPSTSTEVSSISQTTTAQFQGVSDNFSTTQKSVTLEQHVLDTTSPEHQMSYVEQSNTVEQSIGIFRHAVAKPESPQRSDVSNESANKSTTEDYVIGSHSRAPSISAEDDAVRHHGENSHQTKSPANEMSQENVDMAFWVDTEAEEDDPTSRSNESAGILVLNQEPRHLATDVPDATPRAESDAPALERAFSIEPMDTMDSVQPSLEQEREEPQTDQPEGKLESGGSTAHIEDTLQPRTIEQPADNHSEIPSDEIEPQHAGTHNAGSRSQSPGEQRGSMTNDNSSGNAASQEIGLTSKKNTAVKQSISPNPLTPSRTTRSSGLLASVEHSTSPQTPSRRTRASGHVADHVPTDWSKKPEEAVKPRRTPRKPINTKKASTVPSSRGRRSVSKAENSPTVAHSPLQTSVLLTPEPSQQQRTSSYELEQPENLLPLTPQATQQAPAGSQPHQRGMTEDIDRANEQLQFELEEALTPERLKRSFPEHRRTSTSKPQSPLQHSFDGTQESAPKPPRTSGLRTALSYYAPLSSILPYLNSQAAAVDVLALVITPSKEPKRATSGQKDYHTSFSITDGSIFPEQTSVQIFRPWKAALPSVAAGDVVLLRNMRVKGLKGKADRVTLASGEDSSWCVWKFPNGDNLGPKEERSDEIEDSAITEEMKGPPVEVGPQEREEAGNLRAWWEDEVSTKMS